jgi:hypothetical protein
MPEIPSNSIQKIIIKFTSRKCRLPERIWLYEFGNSSDSYNNWEFRHARDVIPNFAHKQKEL